MRAWFSRNVLPRRLSHSSASYTCVPARERATAFSPFRASRPRARRQHNGHTPSVSSRVRGAVRVPRPAAGFFFEICAMVGDPELNSFFKNNPIQSSGLQENYPLKVVATHKTIIEDQPFGNRPLGTSSTCRNLPCTRGKGSRRRSSLRRRMHCKKGIHSVGVATQICLGVASEVPDPHIADIGARRSPHNKNPRRWTKSADQVLALAANGSVDLSAQRGEALDGHAEPNRHAGKRPTTRPTSWRRCQ